MEAKEIISSGILEMYVLGQTTAAESAQVALWLKEFPELKAELEAIELSMEQYAVSNAVKPSEKLRQNVFAAIEKAAPASQRAVIKNMAPWKMIAAASIVLLVGSVILNWYYFNKHRQVSLALQENKEELLAANQKMDSMYSDMELVTNKYSRTVALDGMDPAPDAAAKIFWMKNTGEVFIDASNLPEAPEGMQYQLWGFVDGKPVDAGMIVQTRSNNKYNIQKMKSFGRAEAFAVTLETKGGNPTPKGAVYVMGKL